MKENSNLTPASVCQKATIVPQLSTGKHAFLSPTTSIKKTCPLPQRVLKSSTLDKFDQSVIKGKRVFPPPRRVLQTPRHVSKLDGIPEFPVAGLNCGTSLVESNRPVSLKRNQLSATRVPVTLTSTAKKNIPPPRRVMTTPRHNFSAGFEKNVKDPVVATLNFDTPSSPEPNGPRFAKRGTKLLRKPREVEIGLSRRARIDVEPFLLDTGMNQTPTMEDHTGSEVIEAATRSENGNYEEIEGNESLPHHFSRMNLANVSIELQDENEESFNEDVENNFNSEIQVRRKLPPRKQIITEETLTEANDGDFNAVLPEALEFEFLEKKLQNCAAAIMRKIARDNNQDMIEGKSYSLSTNAVKEIKSDRSEDANNEVTQKLIKHHLALTLKYRREIIQSVNSN